MVLPLFRRLGLSCYDSTFNALDLVLGWRRLRIDMDLIRLGDSSDDTISVTGSRFLADYCLLDKAIRGETLIFRLTFGLDSGGSDGVRGCTAF